MNSVHILVWSVRPWKVTFSFLRGTGKAAAGMWTRERPLSGAAARNFSTRAAGPPSRSPAAPQANPLTPLPRRVTVTRALSEPRLFFFQKDNITGRCKPRTVSLSMDKLSTEKQDRDPEIPALNRVTVLVSSTEW